MSSVNFAVPVNHTNDTLNSYDSTTVNEIVTTFVAANPDLWIQNGEDHLPNICYTADSSSPTITCVLTDSITDKEYTVESAEFVGGRPANHPPR